jgi:hypothetical protein
MHNLSAANLTGFCLSALIDQRSVEGMLELDRDGVAERKIILKLRGRTPWLLQDCASLPALLSLTAKSGFIRAWQPVGVRKRFVRPGNVTHENRVIG